MTMHDTHNDVKRSVGVKIAAPTDNTAQVGEIIDMLGFNSLEYSILIGTLVDADATFIVLMEHDDLANFSTKVAVTDDELLGTEAEAGFQFDDDDSVKKIGYQGNKQFIRMTITPVDNTSAATFGAVAEQGHARVAPV